LEPEQPQIPEHRRQATRLEQVLIFGEVKLDQPSDIDLSGRERLG
jgi:hypothetical protein